MDLLISESKRKESDSAIKIGKRYLTKNNKKVQDKVNGKESKTKNKTAKGQALAKEAKRYKDQVIALRAKHKSALTAELVKAKAQHATKVNAIRKGSAAPKTPATPKTAPTK
jgi:hypothetical protein